MQIAKFYVDGLSADEKEAKRAEYEKAGFRFVSIWKALAPVGEGFKYAYTVTAELGTKWLEDVGIGTYDFDKRELAEEIEGVYELENVSILWTSEPVRDEDAYLLHDVEIVYSL